MKCHDCSSEAVCGKTLCKKHAENRSHHQKIIRQKRIDNKLCTACGGERDPLHGTKCEKCYNRIEKNRSIRTAYRKRNNLCTMCSRSKSYVSCWTNNYCPECHLREKFKWHGTKEEAEKIINDLLEKQNYQCALTGRDLRTNKYHIDHIIPRSVAPDKISDPTNWQLIVENANMFKEGITIEEVLSLSKDIVKKAIKDGKIKPEDLSV